MPKISQKLGYGVRVNNAGVVAFALLSDEPGHEEGQSR